MTKHKYNWRPSLPDHRIIKYSAVKPIFETLPPQVDLRPSMPPIYDQGNEGSCTAHALVRHCEFFQLQALKDATSCPELFGPVYTPMSRNFVYWIERSMEGTTNSDAGATTMQDGCNALIKYGVCKEETWPYNIHTLIPQPPPLAFTEAAPHKINTYYSLNNIHDMKTCLAHGFPFVFGVAVFDSFETEEVDKTGIIPMPNMSENCQGGHALCCVGYDDERQVFIFANSWSESWGDKGYGYLPYEYMTSPDLSDDHITIRMAPTGI